MGSKDTGKKIAIGAIFALAIGYIAGILTAPKSGEETRKDIKNASNKAVRDAEKKLKNLYSDLGKALDQAADKTKDLKGKGRDKLDQLTENGKDAQYKVKEVLSAIKNADADDPQLRAAVKQASDAKKNLINYLKK